MKDQNFSGYAESLILLISTAVALPLTAVSHREGLTELFVSLFSFEPTLEFAFRWILVIAFLGSLYIFLIGRVYRNSPLTYLSTHVELRLHSASGDDAATVRTQLLRANQRNVTAVFSAHTPLNGTVELDRINAEIHCESCDLEDRIERFGASNQRVELIHVFGEPLPYSWFMPVVPIWLFRANYDDNWMFFKRRTAKRTVSVRYKGEFSVAKPVTQFAAGDAFPLHNFMVTIYFGPALMPDEASISAIRIQNSAVVKVPFEYLRNDKKVIFRIAKLEREKLRIAWNNPDHPAALI